MYTKTLVKVAWLPIFEKKVLMVRSRGQELFFNVGGKPEPHESDIEALIREADEEVGAKLLVGSIKRVYTFVGKGEGKHADKMIIMPSFSADFVGDIADLKPCGEIEELAWMGIADRHRTTITGRQGFDWMHSNGLID